MSRTILVTGCSSGIGRHCAYRLREAGWRVFATARAEDDIDALRADGFDALRLDYALTDTIRAAMAETLELSGGRLDALFNNGAYGQPGAVEDLATDVLRAQFEANFFGWHELTRLALPVMRAQGHGRIVHCSSILGMIPYRWRGAYTASKYALEGLFQTLRLELGGSGIHVSMIQPGPIVSRFTDNALRHFLDNVDVDASVHAETYRRQLARLKARGGVNRFRLGPEAVYRKLGHALNAPRPRAQYRVTLPAQVMGVIRGITPQALMDLILTRSD